MSFCTHKIWIDKRIRATLYLFFSKLLVVLTFTIKMYMYMSSKRKEQLRNTNPLESTHHWDSPWCADRGDEHRQLWSFCTVCPSRGKKNIDDDSILQIIYKLKILKNHMHFFIIYSPYSNWHHPWILFE